MPLRQVRIIRATLQHQQRQPYATGNPHHTIDLPPGGGPLLCLSPRQGKLLAVGTDMRLLTSHVGATTTVSKLQQKLSIRRL